MKTLAFKFIVITVLLLTVISASGQTKSSITIRSMTIENGDTIVKEKTYNNEGNGIIADSLFDNNSRFLFFNKDYNLDTNFNEHFSDMFGTEMQNFLKKFNYPNGNLMDPDFSFFNHNFGFDIDSNLIKPFQYKGFPDIKPTQPEINNEQSELPYTKQWQPYDIQNEPIVSSLKPKIFNYSTEANTQDGSLKLSFNLDNSNPTLIELSNSENNSIYKEKIPKSKGLYTRLFDLTVYEPGIYYLTVTQGKKQNKTLIVFKKNN